MERFDINPKTHNAAKKQAKIRNMQNSPNPNEREVAKKKLTPSGRVGLPNLKQGQQEEIIPGLKLVDIILGEEKCGKGMYYCYTDKKCKKIPDGLKTTARFSGGGREPEEVGIDKPVEGGEGGNGGGDGGGGGMGESLAIEDAFGNKFMEVVDLIKPEDIAEKCWVGYKKKGMKNKGGKMVPNCVPENEEVEVEGFVPMDDAKKAKISRQSDRAYAKEVVAARFGKGKEANKQMQRRIAMRDPAGRKAALRKEEVRVEEYVDFLITEGYDCSDLTWDDMYEEYQSLDEGLRSAVKRLLGKKKEEPAKPMSRGDQLRKKYNVGPEKSDTSAKAQILKRTRARAERDQKEFGGSRYSKGVADRSKAAHDRQLKGGYSKYGADDARGKGNKARKRAAALTKEELQVKESHKNPDSVKGIAKELDKAVEMHKSQAKRLRQSGVSEATRLPAEYGNLLAVIVMWRGRSLMMKMFFPQASMPKREDVQREIEKVYPGGVVTRFQRTDLPSQYAPHNAPIVRVQKESKDETTIGGGNLKKLTGKAVKRVDSNVDGTVDSSDMKSSDTGAYVPGPDGKKVKAKARFEETECAQTPQGKDCGVHGQKCCPSLSEKEVDEAAGEKDACYKKIKASAKVWPSAYASGRLVQCRKKGAANYGNKSEGMTFHQMQEKFLQTHKKEEDRLGK